MTTAAAVLAEVGQCTAATAPYKSGRCDNDLSPTSLDAARRVAAGFRLDTTQINPADTDAMMQLIQRSWPVVVLLDTYRGWDNDTVWRTGEMTMPPSNVYDVAHAVCLIGYTENPFQPFPRGLFMFRNSWGPDFGRETRLGSQSFGGQGNATLPHEYIDGHCLAAFTATAAL